MSKHAAAPKNKLAAIKHSIKDIFEWYVGGPDEFIWETVARYKKNNFYKKA